MSVHYTHEQSYVPAINRPHAIEQWQGRTPAQLSLVDAWRKAIPVEAPECDAETVRLYAPYDVLLIDRGGVLRTVLYADDRTDLSGLSPCESCEELVDPVRAERCPWCGYHLDVVTASDGIVLRRGGER